MDVQLTSRRTEVEYRYSLSGIPDLDIREEWNVKSSRIIRPDTLVLTTVNGQPVKAEVSGFKIKLSGEISDRIRDHRHWHDDGAYRHQIADAPGWVVIVWRHHLPGVDT